MQFRQAVAPLLTPVRRDRHHARAVACPPVARGGVVLLLAFLLTLLVAAALPAQSQGSLQAGARVVATQPVQEALVLVGGMVRGDAGGTRARQARRTPLATIWMDTRPAAAPGQPRRVATVSFIRN